MILLFLFFGVRLSCALGEHGLSFGRKSFPHSPSNHIYAWTASFLGAVFVAKCAAQRESKYSRKYFDPQSACRQEI